MIDKFFLCILGWIDNATDKVEEVLTFKFPKSKNKNVKSPDNRMDFPIE